MLVRQLFDHDSSTFTYLVWDGETKKAVLIDPVLEHTERDLKLIEELGLDLEYVADTHVHADHITAAGEIAERTNATSIAGTRGASCATLHVRHGDKLHIGKLDLEVLETPGHTDDSLSFHIGNALFTGDTLLIRGCGRTDFQNGDPAALYRSINDVLFALPDDTLVYPGHDYRGLSSSTVGEEKRHNPRLAGKTEADFIDIMKNLRLAQPKRIDEAVPANRACGQSVPAIFAGGERQAAGYFDIPAKNLPQTARFIDVREPHEYTGELGHIEGAELVPLATVEEAAKTWDREQPIVLICRSGRRSARAAEQLMLQGFQTVANMKGGMLAYRSADEQPPVSLRVNQHA